MKNVIAFVCVIVVGLIVVFGLLAVPQKEEYIRIHIRANSNLDEDQNIKYLIKDAVVDFLVPAISLCQNKQDFENILKSNLQAVESVANNILQQNKFNYKCNASLKEEAFPTRSYDGVVFKSGIYDALILELGEAVGDNWWCVVYPPLCFLNNGNNIVMYKSKILEIIKLIQG